MSETVDMSNNVISDKENTTMNTEYSQVQIEPTPENEGGVLDNLFSMDTPTMIMIFAGIVIVLYLLLGRLFGRSSNGDTPVNGFIGKMVDIVLFGLLILWGLFYYQSKSGDILNEEDFDLTKEDILSVVFTLLHAGFETTSTALVYAFYMITTHPDIEKDLIEEIQNVLTTADGKD